MQENQIIQVLRTKHWRIWNRWFVGAVSAFLLIAILWTPSLNAIDSSRAPWDINPQVIARAITPALAANYAPETLELSNFPVRGALKLRYTLDLGLQAEAHRLLNKYDPDYGVFVALDPHSGEVLAMASSTRHGSTNNLSMLNTFPAASISKVITAIAAINENKVSADSIIPFNGKLSSMYKKQVYKHRNNKWSKAYSFEKSFALSVNSVFARVGAVEVGGETMQDYAHRLGFNRNFAADFDFPNGEIEMDATDSWQVAEMASGYTLRNTLSPLHGAVMAATAVNGGYVVAPALVQAVIGPNGVPLYWREQGEKSQVMRADTAQQVKRMMRTTVARGSAKSSFSNFHRGALKDVVVGGKTGSLTGFSPRGKYDWFVGFAEHGERKIAFASLCINKKYWYVKSATLAREVLEFYFRNPPAA